MELLDDLLRLCAAAGAEPEVRPRLPERREEWEGAPLVLVGDDAAAHCRGAARRSGVLLVGRDPDGAAGSVAPVLWRHAVEIGVESVVRLPDAEGWLVGRIADVVEGAGQQALTVGVLGGRGGAGASTLACALAVSAARAGVRTLLVDGDPLGGGLDVLLGGERAEGLRWPDFVGTRGRLAGGALEESLPELHRLRVLSWDRGAEFAVPPEAVRSVLGAARRRGGAVVVDLPRQFGDGTREALAQVDIGLLVVPGELRAVAAAGRVAAVAGPALKDLRAVTRGPYAEGLDERWVAAALGLPLAGELPREPALRSGRDGAPPGAADGPLARFCAAFWDRALDGDVVV
ncbi:septum site-determining protein Ssd [Streptomyces sp. NPDC003691]